MIKKILVLFIIGIILIGTGYAILFNSAGALQEKNPELVIFFDGELKKTQLTSMSIDLFEGEDIIVTVLSPDTQMFFSLTGPDNSTLEEIAFFASLSYNLEAKSNGTYTVNVGNIDNRDAYVIGIFSEQPIHDDEFFLSLSDSIVTASFLILIGFMIVVASIIILVLKKIRSKNKSKKNRK